MIAFNRSQLISALRNSLDAFAHQLLPLTGVAGFRFPMQSMDASQQILHQVTQEHGKSLDGAEVVAALDKQRAWLLQSGPLDEEEGGRTALAGWRLIQDKYARAPFSALTAAHALEDAALHTHQLAAPPRTTWWIEEDDPKEPLERAIDCSSQLDGLAEHVRIHHKDSFGTGLLNQGGQQDLQEASPEQMRAIAHMLSERLRFKHDPYEWVYDGFKPLLLPDVVATRKGTSLSLATLVLCVMRRLGVTARPLVRQDEDVDLSIIGKQSWSPPSPVTVLLCAGTPENPCVMDPGGKRGEWILSDLQAVSTAAQTPSAWQADQVFRLWAEHARTMTIACQRRGESDAVISWMYQHAGLDPTRAVYPGMND